MVRPNNQPAAVSFATNDIPVADVRSLYNPRYQPGSIESFAENLRVIGQLHPITVLESNGAYELLAGQRRLEAMKFLGRTHISAQVLRGISKAEALLIAASENTQRQSLTIPEVADAALKIEQATGKPDCQIAKLLGINPGIVSQARSAMAEYDDEVKATLASAKAAMWVYLLLRKVPAAERNAFAVKCLEEGWSRDEAQKVVKGLAPKPERFLRISIPLTSFAAMTEFLKALLNRLIVYQRDGVDIKLLPQLLKGFRPTT